MSFNLGAPCKHGHRFLLSLGKGAPIFPSFRIERLSTMHARGRASRLRLPSGRIRFFFERATRARGHIRNIFPAIRVIIINIRRDIANIRLHETRERNEEVRNAQRDPTKIHIVFPRVAIFLPFSISIFLRLWILGDFVFHLEI